MTSIIYVSWLYPIPIDSDGFSGVDKEKCTLYVPTGTYQDYLYSNWGIFKNIVEYDVTGVINPQMSSDAKERVRYTINGQRLTAPTKGVNIVKYSDGSVRKEIVK